MVLSFNVAVLITGLGYLGVPLALDLLRQGEQVVGVENFFSTPVDQLAVLRPFPGFRLVRGSINSPATLERALRSADITAVYHLAAQASAHPHAAPTSYTERTNLVGPRLLLEALGQRTGCIVVLASSFRVYGDDLIGQVTEQQPYGRLADLAHLSKVYAEKLLELYAHRHGLAAVAVRLGVVYGLGPCFKQDSRFMTVPNLFCQRAAAGQPLVIHPGAARPVGFIHVRDAVAALSAAVRLAQPGYRPVNAVTEVISVPQVASLVQQQAALRGLSVRIDGATEEPLPPAFTVQSSLEQAGFRARERMEAGLGEVLDHFLAVQPRRDAAKRSTSA